MNAKKNIKQVAFIVVLANLALVMYVLLGAFSPKPMPNPNGYDDFVKAGAMVTKPKPYISEMTLQELKAYVATNEAALKRARVGLSRECRIPDDYSSNYMARYINEAMGVKALAMAFSAEGKISKLEGRTNDAVNAYLDSCAIGEKSCRRGFMMAKLLGIACESIGRRGLLQLTNSLSAPACRSTCRVLESLDKEEDSLEYIWSQEMKFMRASTTLREKIQEWREFLSLHKLKKDFSDKCQRNTLERRQMMLNFAARAYELDKGKRPANAAALVPEYLKKIPQDPFTGKDLVLPF